MVCVLSCLLQQTCCFFTFPHASPLAFSQFAVTLFYIYCLICLLTVTLALSHSYIHTIATFPSLYHRLFFLSFLCLPSPTMCCFQTRPYPPCFRLAQVEMARHCTRYLKSLINRRKPASAGIDIVASILPSLSCLPLPENHAMNELNQLTRQFLLQIA